MRKITFFIGIFALLNLAGCNKEMPLEEPGVVIQKMLTESPLKYQSESRIKANFKVPSEKVDFALDYKLKSRSDFSDAIKYLSESLDKGSFHFAFSNETGLLNMKAEFEQEMKRIGDDVYSTAKNYALNIDSQDSKEKTQFEAFFELYLKPYINKSAHYSMKEIRELIEPIAKIIGVLVDKKLDIEAIQAYSLEDFRHDFAKAKAIEVSKDFGLEKIKTLSGREIEAYHYKIEFTEEGLKAFIKILNDRFKAVYPKKLATYFEDSFELQGGYDLRMNDIINIINQSIDLDVWVGQEDYFIYKYEFKVTKEDIEAFLKITKEWHTPLLTEEGYKLLDKFEFNFYVHDESEPIKSFSLKKPEGKVIDYNSFIKQAVKQAKWVLRKHGAAYNNQLSNLRDEAGKIYEDYTDFSEKQSGPIKSFENHSMYYKTVYGAGFYKMEPMYQDFTELEAARNATLDKLWEVRKKFQAIDSLAGDFALRDAFIADLDNLIKIVSEEEKELNELRNKMNLIEPPVSVEYKDLESDLKTTAFNKDTQSFQRLVEVQKEFSARYGTELFHKTSFDKYIPLKIDSSF